MVVFQGAIQNLQTHELCHDHQWRSCNVNIEDRGQLYTTPQIDAKLFWLERLQPYMQSSLGFRISY